MRPTHKLMLMSNREGGVDPDPPGVTYSVVDHGIPLVGSDTDSGSVTLGTDLCNSAPGKYTHIVFWKTANDPATSRQVALYNTSGVVLATGSTSNEPASGWISVPLNVEVHRDGGDPITFDVIAAQGVVAAVHFPNGKYHADGGFLNARVVNGPLVALAQSESQNGRYSYNAVLTFPTTKSNGTFFGVDVIFEAD